MDSTHGLSTEFSPGIRLVNHGEVIVFIDVYNFRSSMSLSSFPCDFEISECLHGILKPLKLLASPRRLPMDWWRCDVMNHNIIKTKKEGLYYRLLGESTSIMNDAVNLLSSQSVMCYGGRKLGIHVVAYNETLWPSDEEISDAATYPLTNRTVVIRGLPSRWFASVAAGKRSPSIAVIKCALEAYGSVRRVDFKDDDSIAIEADVYVQYEDTKGFIQALSALRGCHFTRTSAQTLNTTRNFATIDYDRSGYFSETTICARRADRLIKKEARLAEEESRKRIIAEQAVAERAAREAEETARIAEKAAQDAKEAQHRIDEEHRVREEKEAAERRKKMMIDEENARLEHEDELRKIASEQNLKLIAHDRAMIARLFEEQRLEEERALKALLEKEEREKEIIREEKTKAARKELLLTMLEKEREELKLQQQQEEREATVVHAPLKRQRTLASHIPSVIVVPSTYTFHHTLRTAVESNMYEEDDI